MKKTKTTAKKRNPADATMRNVRAANRRITNLRDDYTSGLQQVTDRLARMDLRMTMLYERLYSIERRVKR